MRLSTFNGLDLKKHLDGKMPRKVFVFYKRLTPIYLLTKGEITEDSCWDEFQISAQTLDYKPDVGFFGVEIPEVWIVSSTVLFGVYRSVHLDSVTKLFLPEHTRDAAFQLFCDLRTNTPKDAAFLRRHATALQPHTYLGWLAATAFTLFVSAYAAAAAAIALGIAVALINVILVLSVIGGVTLAIALSCSVLALFAGACIAGSTGFTVAVAYTTLESAKVVTTAAGRLLLGGPRKQQEPPGVQLESIPRPQALLEGYPTEAPADDHAPSEAQDQLEADVAAARETAADVAAVLPGPATPAARYAMQKLGLAHQDGPAEGAADKAERRPPPPAEGSSTRAPPPAPLTPPETVEATPHNVLSFLSPTKKRRAASPDSDSTAYASPPQQQPEEAFVDASSSTASDSSQAPDLQGLPGFMDQGFMGSPPASRSTTPARQRAVAAA